ncbi:hypothetical protein ACTM9B_13375 [Lachnospiraceae bacterium HCP1S3_A10]
MENRIYNLTLEEKSVRYETVNKLLTVSSYIDDRDLAEIKDIYDRCYMRYSRLSHVERMGQTCLKNMEN